MTLKELLDLKIVHDNIRLLVFEPDCHGLGDFTEEHNILHIYGRRVEVEDLLKNNVRPELFNYEVKEIWGDRFKNKMGIVIQKK